MGVEARSEAILSPEGDVVRIHQLESVLGEVMPSLGAHLGEQIDDLQKEVQDMRFESFKDEKNRRTVIRLEK